jgi:hypothetical protein
MNWIKLEVAIALALACAPSLAGAQAIDVCGCADSPGSLGAFNAADPATFPPGTSYTTSGSPDPLTIPLPPDGVLVFDSFVVSNSAGGADNVAVFFAGNAANTPVTLLVRGDVTIGTSDRIILNGSAGSNPTSTTAALPGLGGPGGYAGGLGAFLSVNQAMIGGAGLGPGGGAGARPESLSGGGILLSVPELRPLRGGSGGGGGRSLSTGSCAGGGGGGGAGAILIAANGTIQIDGTISANGGNGGSVLNGGCDSGGAGGAAGAIRLVANAIAGGGRLEALGGAVAFNGGAGSDGVIRMESFSNTFGTNVVPVAARLSSPGPLVNPVQPTLAITAVQGAATPAQPVGFLNQIDMIVTEPGIVRFDVQTRDVPTGTDVEIALKPRLGALPVTQRVTLAPGDCVSGVCDIDASFELVPGGYIAEARATFEVP